MAKKDNDNFDFETESEGKGKFDLVGFFKNLTKKQKGIILAAVAGIVLVVAIVIVCVIIGANNQANNNGNAGGNGTNDGIVDNGSKPEVPDEGITQFYLSSKPTKTVYIVNDEPEYSGLSVYIKSESTGSMFVSYDQDPDAFTFTGFDSSKPADELVITVECRGFTDTFTVKVVAKDAGEAYLVGITVDPLPKTTYKVGESFSHTGGYIVAEYSDGTVETIKLRMKHVTGFGAIANTPGEHQVKVEYSDDHGGYAETTITITITE